MVRAGETLLATLVGAISLGFDPVEPDSPGPAADAGLAASVWPALTDQPAQLRLLNAALILLADQDLAISTVAARVAASSRANPYAVVSAGLGALDGLCHGNASTLAYRFLADALADPVQARSERLRVDPALPGFGHRIYIAADPRAELLLTLLRDVPLAQQVLRAIDTITTKLRGDEGSFPSVDLALAAMMHAHDMRPDAGEAIFAIARTIGWIAHAIEEYQQPALRFRPVGVYLGKPPRP